MSPKEKNVDLNDVKKGSIRLQNDIEDLRNYMRLSGDEVLPASVILMIEKTNNNMLTLIQYLMEANGHYTKEEINS
jgi:hypothetical protein